MESKSANPGKPGLFLASGSTARLGLLRDAGLDVTACPVGIDEAVLRDRMRAEGEAHGAIALALANAKALGFFRNHAFMSADFVIAADQILECDASVLTSLKRLWRPDIISCSFEDVRIIYRRRWSCTGTVKSSGSIWRHPL
ncbi:Maf family protein [Asaia astilbis]|uniref:Maf family protein n=1 Tax=Asaia astilbis TaxID=610244 RepID=UPI000A3E51B4|nr:Maf family protein [Asaia astilbis]